ncbi:unnamed protein product, partial [Ixodes pacificus]
TSTPVPVTRCTATRGSSRSKRARASTSTSSRCHPAAPATSRVSRSIHETMSINLRTSTTRPSTVAPAPPRPRRRSSKETATSPRRSGSFLETERRSTKKRR